MLRSIHIQNFRSCRDTTLEFERRATALVGRNGAGKTNLLHAIRLACSVAAGSQKSLSSLGLSAGVGFDLAVDLSNAKYRYSLRVIDHPGAPSRGGLSETLSVRRPNAKSRDIFLRESEQLTVLDRTNILRVPFDTPSIAILNSVLPDDTEVVREIGAFTSFVASVSYYPLLHIDDSSMIILGSEYNNWLKKRAAEPDIENGLLLRLIYMHNESPHMLHEVKSLLGPNGLNLIDSIIINRIHPPSGTSGDPPDFFVVAFKPSSRLGGSGQPLSFAQLSHGTKRLILLIVSIIFDERTVMLIEEPEDSVHVGLVQKVLGLMRTYSEAVQVIFSTHSTDLLDLLEPEEVRLVFPRNGATIARELNSAELGMLPKFLQEAGSFSDFLILHDEE